MRCRKSLKKKVDAIYREIVLLRANNVCELCKQKKPLQCHHVFGRGGAVRWELSCGSGVCADCHEWCTRHTERAREKYRQIRGEGWYKHTFWLYLQTKQLREWQLLELRDELVSKLQKMRKELR